MMARRERVASVTASPQPQTQWGQAAAASGADPDHETEIAAFSRSPSPGLDSPRNQLSAADSQGLGVRHESTQDAPRAGGEVTFNNTTAELTAADASAQRTSALLASAKQLRATRDYPSKQVHAEGRQRKAHRPGTADIHMIGEITGAVGFGQEALYCTWQLVYDPQLWEVSKGLAQGRTHASSPLLPEDGSLSGVVWETPLDFVLTTTSMQHWPRIVFKLFHRSVWLGRDEFVGYSLCNLPITPGCHHFSCPVWAAVEARRSFRQEITSWFTGLTPQLVNESFITDLEQRYEQGQHLHTRDCSNLSSWPWGSSHNPASAPTAIAVDCRSSSACSSSSERRCRSFSAAGGGGTAAAGPGGLAGAAAGGRICLRLHIVSRGLSQLRVLGGESVGKALERLRDSVDQMRRRQEQHLLQYEEEDEDSEGVRMVREGRAARLAALQQNLDGTSSRDQQQLRDSGFSTGVSSVAGTAAGSFSSSRRAGLPGRASPSRNSRAHNGGGGSLGSSIGDIQQYAGADAEASPSRISRAGRLGTSRQLSPCRFTSSATGTAGAPDDPNASTTSWRMSRESLGASRQQYGSPARGRGTIADAMDMEHRLPPPRFAAAAGPREDPTAAGLRSRQLAELQPTNEAISPVVGRSGFGPNVPVRDRQLGGASAAAAAGQRLANPSPTPSDGGGSAPLLPDGAERSADFGQ